jgi:predicted RNase H-like HicB family nuclease
MLTDYIRAAMERAEYSQLADESFYAEIPGIQGVWANSPTQPEAQRELQEVLEDWITLRLDRHLPVPEIDGVALRIPQVA